MKKKENKISRYLSLVLRHKPEEIGIVPNDGGWVEISELIRLVSQKRSDFEFSEDVLHQVVRNNNKQRFKISDDGKMIRASQGHSYSVDLAYEAKEQCYMFRIIYGRLEKRISYRRYILPSVFLEFLPTYRSYVNSDGDPCYYHKVSLYITFWAWYIGIEWTNNGLCRQV